MNQQDYSLLLHTDSISEFNEKYFEKVLNIEHIVSDGGVNFPKVKYTDGEEAQVNFFGWVVSKNGIYWLIPNTDKKGSPVNVKDIFPLEPTKWDEVGYQSKAYRLVDHYNVVKYKSDNVLGMRGLVDALSSIPHSNNKHRKLLVMAILSQVFNRSYYRFSSPPGFGKDSIVDTLGLLVGGCATIENPSVPKLEREASIRTLSGLNEVVGLSRNQWVDIGKFILAACAYKPSITKRTRAFGGVGETINLKQFSMSLFYNDINCYTDPKTVYFDTLAEEGIRDRLPALRVHGQFQYDFNLINDVDIPVFVKEHWQDFLDIIYTVTYFKGHNFGKIKYNYDLGTISQRWHRSLGNLLRVVAEYCTSQEEFDGWTSLLKASMVDYNHMLEFPKLLDQVELLIKGNDFDRLVESKQRELQKEFDVFSETIKKDNTFIEVNRKIVERLTSKKEKVTSKNLKVAW